MLGGGNEYPTFDGVFSPGLLPVGFLMDECFDANGYEAAGGIVMLPVEVSIRRHVFVSI